MRTWHTVTLCEVLGQAGEGVQHGAGAAVVAPGMVLCAVPGLALPSPAQRPVQCCPVWQCCGAAWHWFHAWFGAQLGFVPSTVPGLVLPGSVPAHFCLVRCLVWCLA